MSSNSYQHMARQFIELWQKQVSTMVSDRDFVQTMLDGLQHMSEEFAPNHEAGSPPHSAAAAGASMERMAELDYRLRLCEQRIRQLEEKIAAKPKARAGAAAGTRARGKVGGKKPAAKPTTRR